MKSNLKRIGIALLLLSLLLVLTSCGSPEATYKSANNLLAKGKYAEAAEEFASLGSYEDAAYLAIYADACAKGESDDPYVIMDAISIFSDLSGFKDSNMRATYYWGRFCENRGHYFENANAGDGFQFLEQALEYYESIHLFLDCSTRIKSLKTEIPLLKESAYNDAIDKAEAGNYTAADELFEKLDDYKDSKTRITYYDIREAEDLLVNPTDQDAMLAVAVRYTKMENFLDSAKRAAALNDRAATICADKYDAAVALKNAEKYSEAGTAFASLKGYKDSASWSTYCKARACEMTATSESSLKQAQELYENIPTFEDSSTRAANLYHQRIIHYPDDLHGLSEGLAKVKKNGKWGFINKNGDVISEPQWDEASSFAEGLANVRKNGKNGFIDKSGEVIIPLQWDAADSFSEGLAAVKKNGKYGFIDKNGKIVSTPQWDDVCAFSEGLAAVEKNGKWGYIDKNGKVVIAVQWDYVGYFIEGLAQVKENGKYGYIDKSGKVVSTPQWDYVGYFSEGLAQVEKNGKYGYIDESGKVVSTPQWDYASYFSEGLAAVWKNSKCGFIDKSGKVIIEPQWNSAGLFSEGLAEIKKNGKWGYIDKSGKVIIEPQWDYVGEFSEGLAKVEKNSKWGLIDKSGKVVSTPQWDDVWGFSEGLAAVKKNGKYSFIDKSGKVVIAVQWDAVSYFNEGLARVEKNGKYSLIDTQGNIVLGWR